MNPDLSASLSEKAVSKSGLLAWAIFLTGILYYCFAYLLRVYPSIMEPQLQAHFSITAGSFGVLTSFYYFAYAPMQLPVGASVDKIGPRRSLLVACMVSLTGATLFAFSDYYALALLGRFLVGFGCAFAYVTALKLITVWLPRRFFATATGAVTGGGMLAAIFTDIFLTHIVQTKGYKSALIFPVIIGFSILALIFLIVRDRPKGVDQSLEQKEDEESRSSITFQELGHHLKLIIKNPQMWIIGCVGALLYLPSSVFLDVWAIPYMESVYHFTPADAAFGFSVMLTGWICSSFATGALSDILGNRRSPLIFASFGAACIAAFIIYVPHIPEMALFMLLFLFGIFCGPHPLCFTLSKENCSTKISGTAISFSNFLIMMGGFIFQPVVGKLLDFFWDDRVSQGVRNYSAGNYMHALSIIPIGLLVAGVLSLLIKETYNKSVDRQP